MVVDGKMDGQMEGWAESVLHSVPGDPSSWLRATLVQAQASTAMAAGVCVALGSD